VTFMMWVRWTLPRLRIDQVITTCLKYCVPIAAVCFLGVVIWQAVGPPSWMQPNTWVPQHQRGEIREHWVSEMGEEASVSVSISRGESESVTVHRSSEAIPTEGGGG